MKKFIFLTCINYSVFSFGLTAKDYCFDSKENSCVTKFGAVLGSNSGIPAFSNCRSECINPIENKLTDGIISGVSWQCVEYARRWWITKFGISFGSVDTADQIFFLKEATKLKDKKMITLKSFLNHSILPPKY
jgi:hypothetical protein